MNVVRSALGAARGYLRSLAAQSVSWARHFRHRASSAILTHSHRGSCTAPHWQFRVKVTRENPAGNGTAAPHRHWSISRCNRAEVRMCHEATMHDSASGPHPSGSSVEFKIDTAKRRHTTQTTRGDTQPLREVASSWFSWVGALMSEAQDAGQAGLPRLPRMQHLETTSAVPGHAPFRPSSPLLTAARLKN